MKAIDILKIENKGKLYIDNKGETWTVEGINEESLDLYNGYDFITRKHTLGKINSLNFEEVKRPMRMGQEYYYMNACYEIFWDEYRNDKAQNMLIGTGNYYPYTPETKEDVYEKVKLIRDRKELSAGIEVFAKENNTEKINWNDETQKKYYLFIDYEKYEIDVSYSKVAMHFNTVYFDSKETAEKALDIFGTKLKELYINAEE